MYSRQDASSSARSMQVPVLDPTMSLGVRSRCVLRVGRRRVYGLKAVFVHESGPDRLHLLVDGTGSSCWYPSKPAAGSSPIPIR